MIDIGVAQISHTGKGEFKRLISLIKSLIIPRIRDKIPYNNFALNGSISTISDSGQKLSIPFSQRLPRVTAQFGIERNEESQQLLGNW
ncbi:unnamed protein product [Cylicocyclus nassatus]|uniref:Uncharacterized protein n=1 Tax=Cylicocyclus nassatus TaxID=53992 RepID=A0AA36M8J1_CYLNA|nr:unnamed protein product [Cylicocyclus nassatus]